MSDETVTPQKSPYGIELEIGKKYYWCACGRSNNQPFCDGSHQGTSFEPVVFTADKSGMAYLCGCKKTTDQPYCDGTHQKL